MGKKWFFFKYSSVIIWGKTMTCVDSLNYFLRWWQKKSGHENRHCVASGIVGFKWIPLSLIPYRCFKFKRNFHAWFSEKMAQHWQCTNPWQNGHMTFTYFCIGIFDKFHYTQHFFDLKRKKEHCTLSANHKFCRNVCHTKTSESCNCLQSFSLAPYNAMFSIPITHTGDASQKWPKFTSRFLSISD